MPIIGGETAAMLDMFGQGGAGLRLALPAPHRSHTRQADARLRRKGRRHHRRRPRRRPALERLRSGLLGPPGRDWYDLDSDGAASAA